MIKTIAIVVVVLLAAVLVFAAFKPDTFHVQRATSIKASPEKMFAIINDFHNWSAWSPWEKLDPTMKKATAAQQMARAPYMSGEVTVKSARGA